ncbi:hypothetical protein CJJ23_03125 [Mycoplasmopsis agassizii]|uniref:Uncharacterized protein n=1 Tax=Mycoplasmopsis agassizii TaxID=33922 RepID=A0A269TID0_9BACT|nr:hypothetical protein CJJ23_03125 [Mycoplasmopsis agassizii]
MTEKDLREKVLCSKITYFITGDTKKLKIILQNLLNLAQILKEILKYVVKISGFNHKEPNLFSN